MNAPYIYIKQKLSISFFRGTAIYTLFPALDQFILIAQLNTFCFFSLSRHSGEKVTTTASDFDFTRKIRQNTKAI